MKNMNSATAITLIALAAAGCASLPSQSRPDRSPPVAANDNCEPAPEPPTAPARAAANDNNKPVEPDAVRLENVLLPGKNRSHIDGLDPDFAAKLAKMFGALPADLKPKARILSGYRSVEHQTILFKRAVAKYGSEEKARKWVAPPGKSNHNRGKAVDLDYASSEKTRVWFHAHAAEYGLHFPMSWEPWHIEPVGSR